MDISVPYGLYCPIHIIPQVLMSGYCQERLFSSIKELEECPIFEVKNSNNRVVKQVSYKIM